MATQNDRVRKNSPEKFNLEIDNELLERIRKYVGQSKEVISKRIQELEKEWTMDRLLMTNAATVAGLGLILGSTVNKRWYALSGVVLSFLLQHSIQGWCPPLPLFRKLGVRSYKEIDRERYALKYLRGDFDGLTPKTIQLTERLYQKVSL